jgi:hypothetical protein
MGSLLDAYDRAVAPRIVLHFHPGWGFSDGTGGLSVIRDVEAVVVDPTDRQEHSATLERLGCAVEEHPGYCVTAEAIDPDYRGPVPVQLARLLGGEITPARLSSASRSGDHDPQAIKWLWHCLARFGRRWPDPVH